jgi:peptidoglycan/xylan/chitin deacetylase (PgdA/CDA1 family)
MSQTLFKSLRNKLQIITVVLILFLVLVNCDFKTKNKIATKHSKIAFTFDDGSTNDMPGYQLDEWNQMILTSLDKHDLKSIFFVKGSSLDNEKGREIISSWNNDGHLIGNHTYNHPYYNSKKITLEDMKNELLLNDKFLQSYSNFKPLFRFPYLKEGNTKEKVQGMRSFLKENGYKNGRVTIDASDWFVNARLIKRLESDSTAKIETYKEYYIDHLYDRALFYDSLSTELTGRKINHVMLLHHNLAAALFLDDLIQHFKDMGWKVMGADEAYEDRVYSSEPKYIPAGESLIWAMAKESGKFGEVLRYPGEDSRYEKGKMEKLGL